MFLPKMLDFHSTYFYYLTVIKMFHIVKRLYCHLENPGSQTGIAVPFTFLAAEEHAKCHH